MIGVGELLITAGPIVALFLCRQLWWTGTNTNTSAKAVVTQFHKGQVESLKRAGKRHYGAPPVMEQVGHSETTETLAVPK